MSCIWLIRCLWLFKTAGKGDDSYSKDQKAAPDLPKAAPACVLPQHAAVSGGVNSEAVPMETPSPTSASARNKQEKEYLEKLEAIRRLLMRGS